MESVDSLLAQALTMPAGVSALVTDDLGVGRAVTMTVGVYRLFAARTASAVGTELDPYELLYRTRQVLDPTQWDVTLRADGHVRITYLGLAPNGEIVWSSSTLPNLLGFLTDVGPKATGQHQDGAALPTHAVFFAACEDTGWTREPGRFSGARMPSGRVYGWGDGLQGLTRRLALRLLPKDDATRAALIAAEPASVPPTPCFGPMSRVTAPGAAEPAQVPPWGAVETFATARGRSCGLMIGTLQTAILNPPSAPFDHCYLTPETVTGGASVRLSVELFDPRRDIAAVDLAFYAAETRS